MNRDRYDLPLTTSSDRAAAQYRDGMDCMLSAWHGAAEAFDRAIAHDPGFALAYIGRARVHQLNMEGSRARAMAAQARDLVAGATPREKSHVEIIASVIEGQPKLAISGAEAHLEEYARDALVLSMLLGAFGLYAFSQITMPQNSRSANATRVTTARIGGSSPISVGPIPKWETFRPAGNCQSVR